MTSWTQVRKDVMVTTVGTKKLREDDLAKKLELIPNPCRKLSGENCIDSKKFINTFGEDLLRGERSAQIGVGQYERSKSARTTLLEKGSGAGL